MYIWFFFLLSRRFVMELFERSCSSPDAICDWRTKQYNVDDTTQTIPLPLITKQATWGPMKIEVWKSYKITQLFERIILSKKKNYHYLSSFFNWLRWHIIFPKLETASTIAETTIFSAYIQVLSRLEIQRLETMLWLPPKLKSEWLPLRYKFKFQKTTHCPFISYNLYDLV